MLEHKPLVSLQKTLFFYVKIILKEIETNSVLV